MCESGCRTLMYHPDEVGEQGNRTDDRDHDPVRDLLDQLEENERGIAEGSSRCRDHQRSVFVHPGVPRRVGVSEVPAQCEPAVIDAGGDEDPHPRLDDLGGVLGQHVAALPADRHDHAQQTHAGPEPVR